MNSEQSPTPSGTLLNIADGLPLPLQIAARTVAILAQKGAGKTYTGLRMAEEMLAHNQQVVALDPTGVWWGLRAPAPGGRAFELIILGGAHGDAPLEPTAGSVVAEVAVNSGRSMVLDLSHFESNAAQDRFVADFLETLYRRKASARTTLHLILDEADSFAPQRPGPSQMRMLGAAEAIVRRGRSRGLGVTMISQRPAVLNKNILSQVDLLIALRVVGPHDAAALKDWASLAGSPEQLKEFIGSLPKLAIGEAWFWSPGWLGIFQKATVTKRVTFDSSRTPEPGETATEPRMAAVDMEELREAIAATVKIESDASGHRGWQKEKARMEAELCELRAATGIPRAEIGRVGRMMDDIRQSVSIVTSALEKILATPELSGTAKPDVPETETPSREPVPNGGGAELPKAERMVLTALKQCGNVAVKKRRLALLAGYAVKGGAFNNTLSSLRTRGWIAGSAELLITPEGSAAVGPVPNRPRNPAALLTHWRGQLGKAEAAILEKLALSSAGSLTKKELAAMTGYESKGGAFNNALSRLRTLELIEGSGTLQIAEEFVP